ncbi:hypothetical protein uav_036 [Pseudomonas phage UAVern]|uniref:Uncharacterized protein n=1 Tax=Pseudomonas phage UAVern TaxID=2856997 RepID=A0A975UY30_9CAUD|nr:hypothetical protein uav_036 [Pseudomonas phage UAVern]
MSKPQNFQIRIANREAFQRTWDGLEALGYNLTSDSSERQYKEGGVIKHNSTLGYIWSSVMIDGTKTTHSCFEAFLVHNRMAVPVPKPTMSDAIQAVELDQEIGMLQAHEANMVERLNELRNQIASKLNDLKAVQQKLGITA